MDGRAMTGLPEFTRRITALTGRPVFASGIENRSRIVVALCGASNGRWTTTLRRRCGARANDPDRDYRVGVEE
jgi:hypothetical protein